MLVERKHHANAVVLRPDGKLTVDLDKNYLVREIQEELENGHQNLIVDLTLSPLMDSFGLGIMIRSLKAVNKAGGTLALCGVGTKVANLFVMANVHEFFKIYTTEKEAIESFE